MVEPVGGGPLGPVGVGLLPSPSLSHAIPHDIATTSASTIRKIGESPEPSQKGLLEYRRHAMVLTRMTRSRRGTRVSVLTSWPRVEGGHGWSVSWRYSI